MTRATTGGRYVRDKATGVVTPAAIDEAKASPAPAVEAKPTEPQIKTPTGGRGK